MSNMLEMERITLFGRENVSVYRERLATLNDVIKNTVNMHLNKTAFILEDRQITYAEVDELSSRFAGALQMKYKIKKGDHVLCLIGNNLEFPIVALACIKIGAIMVPVNTKLKTPEISFIIDHSKPKLIISDDNLLAVLKDCKEEYPNNKPYMENIIQIGNSSSETTFDSLVKEDQEMKAVTIKETDPAFILYTSGTTGRPKGAIISHINVIHSLMHFKRVFQTNEQTRTIIAVPLFHVTGLVGQFLHVFYLGGSSVILKRYNNEDYIKQSFDFKVNFHFNAPTMFIMMSTCPLLDEYSFDFVRTVAYGGSAVYQQTLERLKEIFPNANYHNAYGATETSSPTTLMPITYPMSKVTSIGLAVENAQLKVIDDNGNELGVNEPGELIIKGPMVIGEYLSNDIENENSFLDGYWKSGDVAKIDEDGFVFVLDRKKDMINRGGEKIFSIEVEDVLKNHDKIKEATVVAISDDIYGEKVKAVIVSDTLNVQDIDDIHVFCSKYLAKYKVPEVYEFIDELPKTASGKILKHQLRSDSI